MIGTNGERESGKSVQAAQLDNEISLRIEKPSTIITIYFWPEWKREK